MPLGTILVILSLICFSVSLIRATSLSLNFNPASSLMRPWPLDGDCAAGNRM